MAAFGDAGVPLIGGNLKSTWVLVMEMYFVTTPGFPSAVLMVSLGNPSLLRGKPVPLAVTVTSPLKPILLGVMELIVISFLSFKVAATVAYP